ncbi:MAG: hypothetical protein M3277_06820 [Actinomycetota bacterium]|nr:hypothetical protein [Actinomycetota bacterium]
MDGGGRPEFGAGRGGPGASLTPRQRDLWEALVGRDVRLGVMYVGAIHVLVSGTNPDRLALAAHGLRELMEKMPPYVGVEGAVRGRNMTDKIRQLRDNYSLACQRSESFDEGTWKGNELDGHLREFLYSAGDFFDSMEREAVTRSQAIEGMLQRLDPYASDPPEDLARLRVQEWNRTWRFFENVSHHRFTPSDDEFRGRMDALEVFLQDALIPKTFEVHDELDKLIERAERDADS